MARDTAMIAVPRAYIAQGEYAIGRHGDPEISAILGSCISVCLWDRNASIGGMNHILLPEHSGSSGDRFGACEKERLVNALTKCGAERTWLEAKVFGGASMLFGLTDTGKRNSDFATAFLRAEDIPLTASSIGGDQARQIRMNPGNGRVRLRFVPKERAIPLQDKLPPCANGVELL